MPAGGPARFVDGIHLKNLKIKTQRAGISSLPDAF